MFRLAMLVFCASAIADVQPSCADAGTSYVSGEKMNRGPDGAYVMNALSCQQSCASNPYCAKFTWKGDTAPAGGCWLISDVDAPVSKDPAAVSGPKICDNEATKASKNLRGSVAGKDSNTETLQTLQTNSKQGKTLVASTAPNLTNTFIVGILAVLGTAGAIMGVAGATLLLLGKKPKKTRSLKAQDERVPMVQAPVASMPAPVASMPAPFGSMPAPFESCMQGATMPASMPMPAPALVMPQCQYPQMPVEPMAPMPPAYQPLQPMYMMPPPPQPW